MDDASLAAINTEAAGTSSGGGNGPAASGSVLGFALNVERIWRCLGLFATYTARDAPYAIFISIQPRATAAIPCGVVAVRVSALDPLVPWLLCPLFEHRLILSSVPDERGFYRVERILGAPDFAASLWKVTGIESHHHDRKTDASAHLRAALGMRLALPQLVQMLMQTCALSQSGGMEEWRWSPMSRPVRCQLVPATEQDPIGVWSKRKDLRERVSDTETRLRTVARGVPLFTATQTVFWREHAALYSLTKWRVFDLLSTLMFGTRAGREFVRTTQESEKMRETLPLVSVAEVLVAFENEQPVRSVLGAYAILCIDNPLRSFAYKAVLTEETLVLPLPIVETREQGTMLNAVFNYRHSPSNHQDGGDTGLPRIADLGLLFVRAAVHRPPTRGVLSALSKLPAYLVSQMALELAANVITAQAKRGFDAYGSTARTFDIGKLLSDTRNGMVAKILGPGSSIVSWLHGSETLFATRAEDVCAHLLKHAERVPPMSTQAYWMAAATTTGKQAASSCRLVGIASAAQFQYERDCVAYAQTLAAQKRLHLLSLDLGSTGGASTVRATVELFRTMGSSLRATAIVTSYDAGRRALHFAHAMGYTDAVRHVREWNELRAAVISLRACITHGNTRFETDCNTLLVDSAHFLDAHTLGEILAVCCARPDLQVLIVGTLALVPSDPRTVGAVFRDLVRALPEARVSNGQTLVPETRIDEVALLRTALTTWHTHCRTAPLVSLSMERPQHDQTRTIVATGALRLPYTARADLLRRSHAVLHDVLGNTDNLGAAADLTCEYMLPWSELAWMSRGELLVLLSHGHPVVLYDDKRAARKVAFPSELVRRQGSTEQVTAAIASVFAASKFGAFRTTAWELVGRHGSKALDDGTAAPLTTNTYEPSDNDEEPGNYDMMDNE